MSKVGKQMEAAVVGTPNTQVLTIPLSTSTVALPGVTVTAHADAYKWGAKAEVAASTAVLKKYRLLAVQFHTFGVGTAGDDGVISIRQGSTVKAEVRTVDPAATENDHQVWTVPLPHGGILEPGIAIDAYYACSRAATAGTVVVALLVGCGHDL